MGKATVLAERRRDGDVIAGFLIVAFAVAACRGAAHAPVLAAVMGILAVVAFGIWARWRLLAPRRLTITADEITHGRPGRVVTRMPRTAAPLDFTISPVRQSGCWLSPRMNSGVPSIPMLGFNLDEVRRACVR